MYIPKNLIHRNIHYFFETLIHAVQPALMAVGTGLFINFSHFNHSDK